MKRHLIIEQAEIEERPEENRDDDDFAVQLLGILFQEAEQQELPQICSTADIWE